MASTERFIKITFLNALRLSGLIHRIHKVSKTNQAISVVRFFITQASTPTRSSGCSVAVYRLGIVIFLFFEAKINVIKVKI